MSNVRERNAITLGWCAVVALSIVVTCGDSRDVRRTEAPLSGAVDHARAQPVVYVATLGHEGHGKTTLTAAIARSQAAKNLAKVVRFDQIDKAPEESAHGIRFAAMRVEYGTATRRYVHMDCPTNADYVKSLITGAMPLDGAILVVSAIDGPQLETHEQVRLAGQVGVPRIVVFLNKMDLPEDTEIIDLIEMEVRELLLYYGFPGDETPIIRGSALKSLQGDEGDLGARAIEKLLATLDTYVTPVTKADDAGERNQARAKPTSPRKKFQAEAYMLSEDEGGRDVPMKDGFRLQLRFPYSTDATGVATLPEGKELLMRRDNVTLSISLDRKIAMDEGIRFQIREQDRTVGIGVVTKVVD